MIHRALILAILLFSLPAPGAFASSVRFEAELATERQHNAGGGAIVERTCGSASNSFVMGGLDAEGDYLEFELTLDAPFCFDDSLRADATPGSPWQFRLEVLPAAGGSAMVQELYPEAIGHGIECPVRFDWVGSTEIHCLEAGDYWIRIVRVGSGETRVDCLDLREQPTPSAEISWGRVKALFE